MEAAIPTVATCRRRHRHPSTHRAELSINHHNVFGSRVLNVFWGGLRRARRAEHSKTSSLH
eukprot:5254470-Alexandrium_andersonii.AAC.1